MCVVARTYREAFINTRWLVENATIGINQIKRGRFFKGNKF